MPDIRIPNFRSLDLSDVIMPIIAIYGPKTKEYPGKYVARLFDTEKPMNAVMLERSLDDLQEKLEEDILMMGLVWIPRDKNDDPNIIGTYI